MATPIQCLIQTLVVLVTNSCRDKKDEIYDMNASRII